MRKKAYDERVLWPVFSTFIRLRDADLSGNIRCFTCGRIRFWKEADAGHGLPRQHMATKYHEQNVHAQCKNCNGFQGGARELYKINVDKKYGPQTWDKLEVASRRTCHRAHFEYDAMKDYYNNEIKKLRLAKHL